MFLPVKPQALDCESCSELLPRHLAGELDAPRMARVREHIAGCEPCRAGYVGAAETLAAMGAQHRHERQQIEAQVDSLRRKREAEGPHPFERRSRLRFMVWPALAIVLLGLVSRSPWSNGPKIVARSGQVFVNGIELPLGGTPGELVPGRACWTGPQGTGEIQSASGRAELQAGTVVVYQSTTPLCLRLDKGVVRASGLVRILFPGGLLELDGGAAEVALHHSGTSLRSLEGEALLLSAEGRRRIEAGQEHLLSISGE